jgi:hypothetical protein
MSNQKMNTDRTIGVVGIAVGVIGLVIGVAGLWLAYVVSPWATRNDHFCYQAKFVYFDNTVPPPVPPLPPLPYIEKVRSECYYTRAECEEHYEAEVGSPDFIELALNNQPEPPEPISKCQRED